MTALQARKKLKKFITDKKESWDLAEAALLVAAQMYPDVETGTILSRLDDWSRQLHGQIRGWDKLESIEHLARFLGEEAGLQGNNDDYYNPDNSMLNRVLDTKLGSPISLSIIYLSVAARLGLPLQGIALPGHFVVAAPGQQAWYDPFEQGRRLQKSDLQAILDRLFGPGTRLTQAMLEPVGKRVILVRLIRNLKQVFVSRQDLNNLLWCAELALILEPKEAELIKERGLVYYQLGRFQAALSDIQAYLQKVPRPAKARDKDPDSGRQHVELLYRVLNSMN